MVYGRRNVLNDKNELSIWKYFAHGGNASLRVYGEITSQERSEGLGNLRGQKNWKLVSWKKKELRRINGYGVIAVVLFVF